jgi:hypothetical protein
VPLHALVDAAAEDGAVGLLEDGGVGRFEDGGDDA